MSSPAILHASSEGSAKPPTSEGTSQVKSTVSAASQDIHPDSQYLTGGADSPLGIYTPPGLPFTYSNTPAFQYNAFLHPVDTSIPQAHPTITSHRASPLSAELRIQTDIWGPDEIKGQSGNTEGNVAESHREIAAASSLPVRTPSLRAALKAAQHAVGSLSPASIASSPGLGSLADITPLPSPIGPDSSPTAWRKMAGLSPGSPPDSIHSSVVDEPDSRSPLFTGASPKKRKAYNGLIAAEENGQDPQSQIISANATNHERNRSLSEYVPGGAQVPRSRYVAVSGQHTPTNADPSPIKPLHREAYLAVQRGISIARPPTPPRSTRSTTNSSDLESLPTSPRPNEGSSPLRYEARLLKTRVMKRWSAIRQLGKGTFSTVMLATSDNGPGADRMLLSEDQLDPRSLVAVKICEHGPAGGADEKKIESSLKRELEILKSIEHPSLVHLKAVNVLNKRAFLVLNYSAGGDLFEFASLKADLLVPSLVRRIFSELVAGVRYLHAQYIVHRDIKLENVLVNLSASVIPTISDWQTYSAPLVTLTDLGLGRWIPRPPESPLLHTRCGSEDYAAPELLMGQEYDGRTTDAWALGVLLYAIMEGRLPFDPIPGARRQSPRSHRIARCEWSWVKWADAGGEWDVDRGKELVGGRECVEGLLKRARTRWSLDTVADQSWVSGGVAVDGGLRRDTALDGDE